MPRWHLRPSSRSDHFGPSSVPFRVAIGNLLPWVEEVIIKKFSSMELHENLLLGRFQGWVLVGTPSLI